MSVMPLPIVVSVLFTTMVRLVLAIQLTAAVRRTGQRVLQWLAVYYFATFAFDICFNLNTITQAVLTVGGLQVPVFAVLKYLFGGLGDVAMVMFIHQTFYHDRRSPYLSFIGSAILVSVVGIGIACFASGTNIFNPFIWGWLAVVADKTYRQISDDKAVEDWVKVRYQLVIAYAVMLVAAAMLMLVVMVLVGRGLQQAASVIIITDIMISMAAIILQYLAWAMPDRLRNWFNRNQQAHKDELIHAKMLAIFDILGTAMSEGTGITKTAVFYVIRKIISQEIETEDTQKIEKHMIAMGYDDWAALLANPKWDIFVEDYDKKINTHAVLDKAKHALIEKQSLITMQSK